MKSCILGALLVIGSAPAYAQETGTMPSNQMAHASGDDVVLVIPGQGKETRRVPACLVSATTVLITEMLPPLDAGWRVVHNGAESTVKELANGETALFYLATLDSPIPFEPAARELKLGERLWKVGSDPATSPPRAVVTARHTRANGPVWSVQVLGAADLDGALLVDSSGEPIGFVPLWGPDIKPRAGESQYLVALSDIGVMPARPVDAGAVMYAPIRRLADDHSAAALLQCAASSKEMTSVEVCALLSMARDAETWSVLDELRANADLWNAVSPALRMSAAVLRSKPTAGDIAELRTLTELGGAAGANARLALAMALFVTGDAAGAKVEAIATAGELAGDPRPEQALAAIAQAEHDVDGLIERAAAWQGLDWEEDSSYFPAGQLYEWRRLEEAGKFIETGLKRWPESGRLHRMYAMCAFRAGDKQLAREELRNAVTYEPSLEGAWVDLWKMSDAENGERDKVAREWQAATKSEDSFVAQAKFLSQHDQWPAALEVLQRGDAAGLDSKTFRFALAGTLWRNGRSTEAVPVIEKVVQDGEVLKSAWKLYALIMLDADRLDDALRGAQAAVEAEPENGEVLRVLAMVYVQRRDIDEFRTTLAKLRDLDPDQAEMLEDDLKNQK